MSNAKLEKARAAAAKAAEEIAQIEAEGAAKAAQEAADRDAKQRELDTEFLAVWEELDTELMNADTKSSGEAIYRGADPIQAVAAWWINRTKRNAIRARAREAYARVHGVQPEDGFAFALRHYDMNTAAGLDGAIQHAARLHTADLMDDMDKKWIVS